MNFDSDVLRATLQLFERGARWGSLHRLPEWPSDKRKSGGRVFFKKAIQRYQTTGASQPNATVGRSRVPSQHLTERRGL